MHIAQSILILTYITLDNYWQLCISENSLPVKDYTTANLYSGIPETFSRYCQKDKNYPQCLDLASSSLPDVCFPVSDPCSLKNVYYRIDGSCNNIKFPMWGQTGTGYLRLLQPAYADGNYTIVRLKDGSNLPNARYIANTLFPMKQSLSNHFTAHFYSFGQFITHDVTHMEKQKTGVSCCQSNNYPSVNMPDECLPSIFPLDDPFYSKFNVTCIDNKRSITTENVNCHVSPVFQINFATAFLDLSVLYGTEVRTANNIREMKYGKLKYMKIYDCDYPQIQPSCPHGGLTPGKGPCMLTGDTRINQNPELTVNEIIFLRMHNYIAGKLYEVNPSWDDERIYQESRRILIALYQHVVYSEHLKLQIGPELMEKFELKPLTEGFAVGLDDTLNPQTIDAYEAAACRFAHSLILGKVNYKKDFHFYNSYYLRDKYFNQNFLLQGNTFKQIIKAYADSQCDEQDEYHTPDIRNFLFKTVINPEWGSDLITLDIIRARDHGVPSYNEIRKACGLEAVQSFEELGKYLTKKEHAEKLKSLYKYVDNIEFYTAGLLEKVIEETVSGLTAACVIAESFYRWKNGDRIFYEFSSAGFKPEQLQTIRKAKYSMFLCLTNPDLKYIQENSFILPSKTNPIKNCREFAVPDFALWKE